MPGVQVSAVCDPNPAAVERMRAEFGIANGFATLELLDGPPVDVAHVVNPPGKHAETARRCLERGLHVYVEKPFTQTLSEARSLLDLAEQAGLVAMPGHQLMFERPTRVAMELLPGIGRVVHVESYFSFRPSRPMDGRPGLSAPDQLLDILPHPTYLLEHFLSRQSGSELELEHLFADESGEVRALFRCGGASGVVVTTLTGRPVESFVRVVGSRGTLSVDYVRGIVVRSLEAGTLGKIVNPYAEAWTRIAGSTASLGRRFLKRERYYPGLTEAFGALYRAVREGTASPVSTSNVLDTVDLCERASLAIQSRMAVPVPELQGAPTIAVTGGTGFLGVPTVRALVGRGVKTLVLSRRIPPAAERVAGAVYRSVDLGRPDALEELPESVHTVIHAAAETVGGWEAHERNSVQATRNLVNGMARRQIRQLVYVSSIAVVSKDAAEPITSASPTEGDPRSRGAYVWGKLRGEQEALALGSELGVEVKIVRPSALVDATDFSPPGKLGRALGPAFVAIGPKRSPLAIVDVGLAGEVLSWLAINFDDGPDVLNLTDPSAPTRGELAEKLKASVPGLRVFWFPWVAVHLVNALLWLPQKVLRRGHPPISLPAVFRSPRYDVEDVSRVLRMVRDEPSVEPPTVRQAGREPVLAE